MEPLPVEHEGESNANELLAAQAHVFHHALSHIGTLSLKCAIELGIPDVIHTHGHGQPLPLSQIISLIRIPPSRAPYLRRVMRLLTHMGYFTIKNDMNGEEDDAYSLTINSKILLKSSPANMCFSVVNIDTSDFHLLSKWFRQAEPKTPFEMNHGCSMWEKASSDPDINRAFNEAIANETRIVANALVTNCKDSFQGLSSVVDVGGGNGAVAMVLAMAFPHIKCTVFDLPHVVATVPNTKLVEAIGGNMFEHIPKADAIFLKSILHDWSDEECVKILKLCREAIPAAEKGGKVIIVDTVLNKDGEKETSKWIETKLYFDVGMLTHTGGKEREEKEWNKIFVAAGFKHYKITTLGIYCMIEVFP